MIVRKGDPKVERGSDGRAEEYGPFEQILYSDAGGLTQFGAYVYTWSRDRNRPTAIGTKKKRVHLRFER